ncbi:thiamine phosphate synthase [Legionella sp. D16C41]|uniref:thiamine phosphate synthase n=1 Tax=Legionella sp. D16C41 TaxID=3402688 RepID=UPI003AF42059
MKKPIVWSIAGVDPAGLAGTYLDLETFRNLQVDACAVITAVTAQNSESLTAIAPVSSEHVAIQCATLYQTFKPQAIKIGMLGTLATQEKIAQFLKTYAGYVVLDPLLNASAGSPLMLADKKLYLENLIKLFPYTTVITPNRLEAEILLNCSLNTYQAIEKAAKTFLALGAKSVLIKGGHVDDSLFSQDYWSNGQESFWLANQRSVNKNYRGTGCMLSSVIAACLALSYSLKDALVIAKMYINRGIRQALALNQHTAKLVHGGWPEEEVDLPYLSPNPLLNLPKPFRQCELGLYPVVDSSHWLEKLLPQGVKCIQLRIKNKKKADLEKEIKASIALAKKYGATLFINDYWELAIRFGAIGIHLGQEDLKKADIATIYQSDLYLGLSTHCYYEVARAHTIRPSYIACGPIYPTTSKIMLFKPQGIEQLERWRRTLHYPLVAIGGINFAKLAEICKSKVEGIALISAITKAANPEAITQQLLTTIKELNYA